MMMAAGGSDATEPLAFSYHRGIAPMLWVFFGLASIELVVVHFLLALWSPDFALGVSILTLPVLIWLVVAIATFRRLPIIISDRTLVMRTGRLRHIDVPLDHVAGVRANWSSEDLKGSGVANLALIAYPNVLLDLSAPVETRRGPVRAIAHKLDDPAAFRAALASRCSAQR